MSTVKINNVQVGQSGTASQNFTITAAQADGTLKLARGNPGVTTQDILNVAADGKVDFPAGLAAFLGANQSLAATGYQKLPGGLTIQWGTDSYLAANGATGQVFNFPRAFQTSCFRVFPIDLGAGCNPMAATPINNAQYRAWGKNPATGAYADTGFGWIAIGV